MFKIYTVGYSVVSAIILVHNPVSSDWGLMTDYCTPSSLLHAEAAEMPWS